MDRNLTERLYRAFPLLYADKDASISRSCMAFDFECNNGWFPLIWKLSEQIEPLIEKFNTDYPDHMDEHPRASQVKEKFGSLCFYMTSSTEEMQDIIENFEKRSSKVCEICGNEGQLRNDNGWYSTACEDCGRDRNGNRIPTVKELQEKANEKDNEDE